LLRLISSAVGAVDGAAKGTVFQVHLGGAVGFKIDPANVRAIGEAAEVAEAIVVEPESAAELFW